MFANLRQLWRSQRRRIVAAVTLLAHLVGAIGLPLPESAARTPCGQAASACCCGTAEQCRASGCGCPHSPALTTETPPAEEEDETPSCCTKKTKPKSCCDKSTKPKPTDTDTKKKKTRWTLAISAQKCRGGTFTHAGDAAPLWVIAPFDFRQYWPLCDRLALPQETPFLIVADILDPPPRVAS